MKDRVQFGSELCDCKLSFTRLVAHLGTVLAEKGWLGVAGFGFAPIQSAQPGLVALGKCGVHLETSGDLCPPPAKV